MTAAFEAVDGVPPPGSALDQNGLRDGANVVEDYLAHGEVVVALEHLIYMVGETDLPVADSTRDAIVEAGRRCRVAAASLDLVDQPGESPPV